MCYIYRVDNMMFTFFSSPGQSPGRAVVLTPALAVAALALAKSLTLKFL